MQNVAPTRTLNRRSRDLLVLSAIMFLFGTTLTVIGLALHIINLVVESNPGFETYNLLRVAVLIFGVILMGLSLLMALRAVTWKTDNALAEQVGIELAKYLDKRYVFIRNISKRSVGYVDAVLIGPPGVLVFRISDKQGVYFNEKGEWLRQRDKGKWRTMSWNPTKEVVADIQKLREYLVDYKLNEIPVYGVIVFTVEPPINQFTVQEPLIPVTHLSQFSYSLQNNYFAKDRLAIETVQQIVNLLYN